MRPKTLIGLLFVGVFGFFVVTSFSAQVSGYETFSQAAENGRRAHVVGTWVEDAPTTYDPDRNVFSFVMADADGLQHRVEYADPKPANFEDAEQVVVEGQMAGDAFAADHILVKCPSKYNDAREFETAEPGEAPASVPASAAPETPAATS